MSMLMWLSEGKWSIKDGLWRSDKWNPTKHLFSVSVLFIMFYLLCSIYYIIIIIICSFIIINILIII